MNQSVKSSVTPEGHGINSCSSYVYCKPNSSSTECEYSLSCDVICMLSLSLVETSSVSGLVQAERVGVTKPL